MRYLRADPWPLRLSLMLSLFHHCIDVENKLSQNYWFCSQAIFFQFWLSLIKIYFSRKFIKWGIVETISSWTACLFLFLMNICHRMPCLEIQFWTEFNTHAHNMTALFEEKTCYWEMSPAFIVTKKKYPSTSAIQMAFFYIFPFAKLHSFWEIHIRQSSVCLSFMIIMCTYTTNQEKTSLFPPPKDFVVVCR